MVRAAPVAAEAQAPVGEIPAPPEVASDPKAAHSWEILKRENKELKSKAARVAELEAQVAAAKAQKPPEIEALAQARQQIQALEDRIGQLDLRESSEFKQSYDAPIQALFSQAAHLLVRNGHDSGNAVSLVRKFLAPGTTDAEIQAELAELPGPAQAAVYQAVVGIQDLAAKRQTALTDWQATKAAQTEAQSRTGMLDLSKQIVEDTNAAVETLRGEQNWLFMESESDQEWNQKVHDRIRAVRAILRDSSQQDLVKYVADGVTAPHFRKLYLAERDRAARLQRELDLRVAAAPGITGHSGSSGAPAPKRAAMSIDEGLDKVFPDRGPQSV